MSTEKPEKKKRARRNYAKNWERLTFFLETVIRVKAPDEETNPAVKEQLRAYRDTQAYMEGK